MGRTITYKGFHPYDHQRAVINEVISSPGTNKVVVCKSSRQKGKSYMIANLLLYMAINNKKTKNYCVSPTIKQAKIIYRTIIDAISTPGGILVKSKNATNLTISLINGSIISFKSAEQGDALRGYTADFLCIDEAAFISDEVMNIIRPWCDVKKATMLLTSTPFTKNGFFWDYFNYGINNQNNTVTVDWSDEKYRESIEQILSPERLEEYRKMLPKNIFQTEYLGEWLDGDGMVFTSFTHLLERHQITPGDKLYWGIDWANQGENDYTVLTAFNQYGHQVFLKYWNDLTPLGQVDEIWKQLQPYIKQTELISCETNSIGTPYTDLLKSKSQITAQKIDGFMTSNTSKNDIVVNMQFAIENGDIRLYDDDKLKREFGYFTATYNPKTRVVTYAAPGNLHDDVVMATLIAYNGLRANKSAAQYSISFKGGRPVNKHNKWKYDRS